MTELEQAAVDYIAARIANENAEPCDWTSALVRVEGAYARMVELSGLAMPAREG